MSHWLPAIDIAITEDPAVFLDGMAELARADQRFDVERLADCVGISSCGAVRLGLRPASIHQDLLLGLFAPPDQPNAIKVELSARRWSPDPATHEAYVEAANTLLGPLLTAWNTAHSTGYRLRFERFEADRFRPSDRTSHLLERFAVLANTSSLHPLDWNRFYLLVREGRQQIPEHELRAMLRQRGFSDRKANELAELYGHLWAFKQLR
jgi:hypothetical protein